jgi:hypothetical protein
VVVIRQLYQVVLEIFDSAALLFSTHFTLLNFSVPRIFFVAKRTPSVVTVTLSLIVSLFTAVIRHWGTVSDEDSRDYMRRGCE